MTELITVQKSHPDFERYLLGTFSKKKRAIPVQSLNVNSQSESVTFKLVPVEEIQVPFFIFKWAQILKLRNFLLVVFPIFIISVKNFNQNSVYDALLAAMSAFGVLYFHAAANLRNDFQDHMTGLDRINSKAGSRAIQEGWITAMSVKRLSFLFIFFGVLCGLPALFVFPQLLFVISILAFVSVIGYGSTRFGVRYRRYGEWIAFFMLGPVLTIGYDIACSSKFDNETVFIGVLLGWLAVFTIHLKNFENIMVQSQAAFENSINKLGFDKACKLLYWWWVGFLVMFFTYHWIYVSSYWTSIQALVLLLMSIPYFSHLSSMESSIGSSALRLVKRGRKLYLMVIALWFIENFWYWLVTFEWQ